ncbi:MAG: LuxR C-terminal-related transcriptional regulator, partial [Coriobacteriales bacterium]|nr:LuxR C-terminal-related transcriptional regulator [Coriobacteriales bacterium]
VIVCFDIVRGTGATVEKTFGWGLLADYGGAVLGAFCYYLFSVNLVFTDLQLMIISTVVVVTLILTSMLLLNERNFDDLWGMSPQASQNFKMACREIALIHRLTPREEEILILLARGRNREFIQRTFTLSKFTVKTHIQRIYEKLNVHSHQELISLVEKLDQSIFS